ncbi:GNAT family N-acetyltransferase [Thermosynechococcaceae cyanobacterium BACA0444]|uniref:GNAT family N-acetyltransferase n=1 Tax=Pseudocalidococcus azoricus BACA0444 TaxID=2918990 RepID=A0AAE4FTG5_9CYAN|nr:GNAT family N-acetyltransferase [Pseudocalidococcus azoricus]MDS3861935.1 GNAT family N-acetyltransferase [Pseudocalidococcus azoricus BACA0444]
MEFDSTVIDQRNYRFMVLESGDIVGTAVVKKMCDKNGDFWHLDDLQIRKNCRKKGYGTALIYHLVTYLLKVNQLPIRVHPAIGQQASEALVERIENLSEQELDEMDRQLEQEMQNPNFWKNQETKQMVFDSEELKKWYRKRGFNIDDPDGKHLWFNEH